MALAEAYPPTKHEVVALIRSLVLKGSTGFPIHDTTDDDFFLFLSLVGGGGGFVTTRAAGPCSRQSCIVHRELMQQPLQCMCGLGCNHSLQSYPTYNTISNYENRLLGTFQCVVQVRPKLEIRDMELTR